MTLYHAKVGSVSHLLMTSFVFSTLIIFLYVLFLLYHFSGLYIAESDATHVMNIVLLFSIISLILAFISGEDEK